MAILGKVPHLPTIVARVSDWRELLWWPSCHLLLWCRSVGKLLLLELWVVALELQRTVWLSRGWHVNHAIFQGSTARTTSRGSWHGPLPLLPLRWFTDPHCVLLINRGTG
jgi:hypothetical protein